MGKNCLHRAAEWHGIMIRNCLASSSSSCCCVTWCHGHHPLYIDLIYMQLLDVVSWSRQNTTRIVFPQPRNGSSAPIMNSWPAPCSSRAWAARPLQSHACRLGKPSSPPRNMHWCWCTYLNCHSCYLTSQLLTELNSWFPFISFVLSHFSVTHWQVIHLIHCSCTNMLLAAFPALFTSAVHVLARHLHLAGKRLLCCLEQQQVLTKTKT